MSELNAPHKTKDFRGVQCPYNYVKTKLTLEEMEAQQILEVIVDEGEPAEHVPQSLKKDGQEIMDTFKDDDDGVHFIIKYVTPY